MELMPVKKYQKPKYPEKYIILENPELLKNIPNRWKKNAYVCIAASTLLAISFSGCEKMQNDNDKTSSIVDSIYSEAPLNIKLDKEDGLIPPVFKHGDGMGSFGCSSVVPPVFLSEEEAFKVVSDEADKYGIKFTKNDLVIKDMEVPSTFCYLDFNGENKKKVNSVNGDMTFDGYDKGKKIGFEFISKEDYVGWKVEQGYRSSVEEYLAYEAAEVLREGLVKKKADAAIGVFYDPMEPSPEKFKDNKIYDFTEEELRKEATDKLRGQVRDFLSWLKAQGII
ncbi:hypothetical protein [Pseudobacteroides cellulosolvens]|uniref:Uncharacterized protein n=1 Tax=Pseudobacteroides cellulosolvens ATCC 35603 = DSM 2933 TaxID=398512 RepID=A0A0L6JJY5_9FIRM|nr:hypothetical protein [Pseudobacteroides cellulosolvens]KNY26079.1 hypothetical protein Bccel_1341 [Pseudobacteroides cellulosolvens ATCC 35603 = DSM 2933]